MSVFDYTKGLRRFSPYEYKFIHMLIDEYVDKENSDFCFLNDIDIDDVDIYWYNDSNPDILGGFHHPSKNVIYINSINCFENSISPYSSMASEIIVSFPTIVHELCHYWQSIKYGAFYFILQIPFIRNYTIELQAYRISDTLDLKMQEVVGKSIADIGKMKKEYGFGIIYFDEIELKMMNRN